MAGFKSERWPDIDRNAGRLHVGIRTYLVHEPHGLETVRDMIVDDIKSAHAEADPKRAVTLLHTLHHFLRAHPEVGVR